MNGPARLVNSSSLPAARELLRAAREDSPPHAALRRTALALGVSSSLASLTAAAGATSGAAVATSIATPSTLALAAKWVAIGALCGAGVAAGANAVTRSVTEAPEATATGSRTARPAPAVPSAQRDRPASDPDALLATPLTLDSEQTPTPVNATPAPKAPVRRGATAPHASGGAGVGLQAKGDLPPAPDLAREVAAIDRARGALGAGNAAGALAQVEAYFDQLRTGTLDREAELLRIEALTATGQAAAASEHARAYAARYPHDPRLSRLRPLLAP